MSTNRLATTPAKNKNDLKSRVNSFLLQKMKSGGFKKPTSKEADSFFPSFEVIKKKDSFEVYESAADFFDYLSAACPNTEFFLFGGMLRDLAIFGINGFNSDIDIVTVGDWPDVSRLLDKYGATKNKFGGYRLQVKDWDIDIWNAEETWAIKNGFVHFDGIQSLQRTTILNWDSILMNWRTKEVICDEKYFDDINGRVLDVKLFENPDPEGMLVRILRHFHLKDAKKFSKRAIEYLTLLTNEIEFEDLNRREKKSYGENIIDEKEYSFFKGLKGLTWDEVKTLFGCESGEQVEIVKDSFSKQRNLFDQPSSSVH